MREICIFVNIYENIYSACDKLCDVSLHEVPHYYDKEVQFVILLNMWYLHNTMVSSFPKRVVKEVGLYYLYYNTTHVFIEQINFVAFDS